MSLYDPERDRVRIAGRWLRWSLPWIVIPALLGAFVSGNVDARSLPLVGAERIRAVLLLDGQAYFGHLDDSGETGTLTLRDVYYFQDAKGGPSGLPVGLIRRGTEAHEPADGMRINREKVLAVEQVGTNSPVALAIQVERLLAKVSPPPVALNRPMTAGANAVSLQRVATEHDLQRSYATALEQLTKLNELVLPIGKAEAQTITQNAISDLRAVRRSGLGAVASALGMTPVDAEAYVRATDPLLEGQSFANEPGVLLAPDLNAIVTRATQLYAQVGDAAAKQLTQPKATPAPSPSARP
ncbi:MAG: hypothetical protein M3T56_12270 [Chloroflexota bacterium]|nr:hypothetical protein [Chloroflexota bacterium]